MKIVLLPGLDGTGVLFRPFIEHLPAELPATVVSYPVDQALGYADLLPRVLGALPQNEPFVILGESFSGPLALMAAARHPAGLRAVILCATFIRNPTLFRWKWLARLVHPILFSAYPRFTSAKALLGGYSSADLRQLIHQAISSVDPRVLAHRVREVLAVDVTEELRTCPVPVLYLRGMKDLVVPSHNARELQAVSPSIQVSAISSPHMVLQTQPAACVEVISTFIRGTPLNPPIAQRWYARPVFFVADVNRALHFYIDLLGFEKRWHEGDGAGKVCQVNRGECEIILCEDATRRDKGRLFVELTPDGLAELRREIIERSVPSKTSWWGYDVIQIEDPDGNELLFPISK